MQFLVQVVNQNANSVKAQSFAFVMEIEVGVVYTRIGHSVQCAFISLFDRFLVTFLVDEVDEILIAIMFKLIVKMSPQRFRCGRQILDLEIRFVTQIIDLGPVHGHTAACLDIAETNVTLERS